MPGLSSNMSLATTAIQDPVDDEPVECILNDVESLKKGEVKTDRNKQKEFTILLVGETGVGKTAVLSLIANVLAGKRPDKYEDFYDLDNEAGGTQKHSQTNSARVYTLTSVNGVTVRILDSPGLADTRGIQQDELHKKSIAEAIQDSIVSVNAVLILANGTVPRLTVGTDYALSTLSAIFPRTLAKNIGFLFTNVSSPFSYNFDYSSLPPVLQYNKQFLLDNPVAMQQRYRQMLTTSPHMPAARKKKLHNAVLEGEDEALGILVEMFDWLDGLEPQPTTDIMSLYDQSQKIEMEIANTLAIMHQAAETDKKLDKVQRELEGAEVDMKTYEKYEHVVNREERHQESTNRHNTVCIVSDCLSNCHIGCGLDFTLKQEELRSCVAMHKSGGVRCQECKHDREFHRHYNSIWVIRQVSDTHVNQEAKDKFENAQNAKERAEELKNQIKDKKAMLQDRIKNATEELGRLVDRYSNLSLSGSFAGQMEKAVKMLEQNLKGMRESGTADSETICKVEASLDSMREKLEVLKKANRSKLGKMFVLAKTFVAFFTKP